MVDFSTLKSTLAYAQLGLISFAAATVPIVGVAQELCGSELFAGEPDAAGLMNQTLEMLDVLEANGVVAFQGVEGRMSIGAVRSALRDGVGSASLLACVLNAQSIEFAAGSSNHVVACPKPFGGGGGGATGPSAGQLFCTNEVAAYSQYLGSEG